ncbi:MAG TPA: WecB/TagA/CpsF family glycosyltransferase [Polyangiaceae bacterium]|nr:WecB/TagA/CpsF family glycosyltransferase [Polyangiaceae bacterium]
MQRVRVGHIWIDALTFQQAVDAVDRLVTAGQGGTIFTPNIDHVVQVEHNLVFRDAYQKVSLSVVDGQLLLWASHLLGTPLPEKISGSDLMLPLARRAAERQWRVYLLGGGPGVADLAARELKKQFDINIVGTDAPFVSAAGHPVDGPAVIDRIVEARPHLLFAAFGAPKQELFLHHAAPAIRPTVGIGVGAGFDFIAGRVKRAPRWISQSGMEWLYRLAQEPRRLARRYLVDDPAFLAVLGRTSREPKSARVQVR